MRTARCKAAKSKHIEYIDNMAYSREQVGPGSAGCFVCSVYLADDAFVPADAVGMQNGMNKMCCNY